MLEVKIEFKNTQQLYGHYLPFVTNGAVFFIHPQPVELGDMIKASVMLPDDIEPTVFEGAIVWVNPMGAQGGRPVGFGVALPPEQIKLRSEIEKLLGVKLNGTEVTSTM